MKNIEIQRSFINKANLYAEKTRGSIMGLESQCEYCEYQIVKLGSDTYNDQTNNCKISNKPDEWFMENCPCATAYNRMKRRG